MMPKTNKISEFIKSLDSPIFIVLPSEHLIKRGVFISGQSSQYISKDYLCKCEQPLISVRKCFVDDLEGILHKRELLGKTCIIARESDLLREKSHDAFHFLLEQVESSEEEDVSGLPELLKGLYYTRLTNDQIAEIERVLFLEKYNPKARAGEFWAHFLQMQYRTKKESQIASDVEKILKDKMATDWTPKIKAQDFYDAVFSFFDRLSPAIDLSDKM